jgi:hypothetical protein
VIPFTIFVTTLALQPLRLDSFRDSIRAEPVILEVRIGDIAATTVSALRVADRALLPLAPVLALAEVLPSTLHRTDASVEFLPSDSVAAMLHTAIVIDWDDLTVTMVDDGSLPVSQRARRERRRATFNAMAPATTHMVAVTRATPLLPRGFVLDYDVATQGMRNVTRPDVRLAIGSTILGGGLDVAWARAGRGSFARAAMPPDISWQRGWPLHSRIAFVRIGALAGAPGSVVGSGLLISNRSPLREDDAGPVTVAGRAGVDWEIEAYRDDVLIYAGIADSTGGYRISLPTSRGANRLSVATYGPDGAARITNRYLSVGNDMIAAGTAAYSASIGRCAVPDCDHAADLSLRYAPVAPLTVGAGVAASVGEHGFMLGPSASLAGRARDDLSASVRYRRDDSAIDVRYSPSPEFDLLTVYRNTALDTRLGNAIARMPGAAPASRSSAVASVVWRPRQGAPSLSATADLAGRNLTDDQRIRVASHLSAASVYVRPFVSLMRRLHAPSTLIGYGAYAESPLHRVFPGGTRIRAAMNFGDGQSGDTFVMLCVPFVGAGRVEAGAVWAGERRRADAPLISMSLSLVSRAVRYDARSDVSAQPAGTRWTASRALAYGVTHTLSHAVSGSVAVAGHASDVFHMARLSASPLRGRTEIAGKVFVDGNANGVFDPSERPLSGVSVAVGATVVETDSAGDYHLRDVLPFEAVILTVDPLTLPSSGTSISPVRVVPLPNCTTRVNLPVTDAQPSGASVRGLSGVGWLAQHAQRGDTSSVHRDHLQPGAGDSHPVAHSRQSAEPAEDVAAKG